MTLREVLQIELWSKQTTRKIVKTVGICFAMVVCIVSIGFALETLWINPLERSTAKVALSDVESLQGIDSTKEDEYKARKDKAEAATEGAQKAAWTWRDQNLSQALYGYLFLIEMEHDEPRRRAALQEFYQKHPEHRKSAAQQQEDISPQAIEFIGKRLHGALD